MTQETPSPGSEPATLRPPIATIDDDGSPSTLAGTDHALVVNIMLIGQYLGRPAFREDLDERMQAEVSLWARSRPTEKDDPVANMARANDKKMLEDFEDNWGL